MIDTSELSTSRVSKEEALSLFTKELVLLGTEEHREEREHLLSVIASEAAKVIMDARPSASVFRKYIPKHHHHENDKNRKIALKLR